MRDFLAEGTVGPDNPWSRLKNDGSCIRKRTYGNTFPWVSVVTKRGAVFHREKNSFPPGKPSTKPTLKRWGLSSVETRKKP